MSRAGWLVLGVVAGCADQTVAEVEVSIQCAPASAWAFPDTAVGQTSSVVVLLTATTDGAVPRPSITGPDAGAFRLNLDAYGCAKAKPLAAGDTCLTVVELAPSVARAQHASLQIGSTTLALSGLAIDKPAGLVASVRNVAALHGFYDVSSTVTVLLTNEGSENAVLGTATSTGDGMQVASQMQCPATLTPGAACEITLATSQAGGRCAAGRFTLPSTLNTVEIPVASRYLGGVSVDHFVGLGAGRIVSSPPGIDCVAVPAADGSVGMASGRCGHAFDEPVTLTAIPEAGNHFNGWGGTIACGDADTCVVDPAAVGAQGSDVASMNAAFASPKAKAIDVTFVGGGAGEVGGAIRCTASCRGWIEGGAAASLTADSPSRFLGWGGACAGTARSCDLGLVVNDRAVTVMFAPDPGEVTTLFPALAGELRRGQVTEDGDLIVAYGVGRDDDLQVARLAPSGEVRWSRAVNLIGISTLKITATGEAYVLGFSNLDQTENLIKLSATGERVWQQTISRTLLEVEDAGRLAVGADGHVVVAGDAALQAIGADGALLWSAPTEEPQAIAIDSTGVVAVISRLGVVTWFDGSGAALAPTWTVPADGTFRAALMFDAQDRLVVQTRIGSLARPVHSRAISVFDRVGTLVFTREIVDPIVGGIFYSLTPAGGLARLPDGQLLSWMAHEYAVHSTSVDEGVLVERYSAAGESTLVLDKQATPDSNDPFRMSITVGDLACAKEGRCALFGMFNRRPWIEVLGLP